ncbi:MAG: tRNA (guanosine(37)-N1)-methyltransferase TrmD [Candidatus Pacebacteria bacterium]|nr:tRNA (guanosine(37)-N1)-methyltransferase TrmD [Candidatus Paceibacterota bacterium]MCD8508132.1 tRNA (guanosine(37)-N1)-methyltransferase TrmD [Candidatus Paceibacterota bacterium]MCD8527796.1 tRNA (guanosine(37)-N1)-methyltransferase TrmD [Candidatus Paceibacterota bacterium]MCD8563767.1 tRNA (guanosine(37)-N1)-methyltransferase TrmD [Candidatus Paceibacterota bacterium]
MKHFHIITLFPDMFTSYVSDSILKRGQEAGLFAIHFYNPRDKSTDKHKSVDDTPYGGGPGMVMSVQPIVDTVESIFEQYQITRNDAHIIVTSPGGELFTNTHARTYMHTHDHIIIICGRYEGIDSRVQQIYQATTLSIGAYILTGGELPAMVMIDAMTRQIEGVLGNALSLEEDRISSHNMYTRPEVFVHQGQSYAVPPVLLSGDHKKIDAWRKGERE